MTDLASTIKKIGLTIIITLSLVAILYIFVLVYLEHSRYHQTKQFVEDCAITGSHNEKHLLELITSDSIPYVYKWTRRMPAMRRDYVRWVLTACHGV